MKYLKPLFENLDFIKDIRFAKATKNQERLRDIAGHISGDNDRWTSAPIKDVNKYLNDYIQRTKDENAKSSTIKKIDDELERLLKTNSIIINTHASVPDNKIIKFIRPILLSSEYAYVLNFLKDSDEITCDASPKVVNKWDVEYSGTVSNGTDVIKFSGIDNGLAVTMN